MIRAVIGGLRLMYASTPLTRWRRYLEALAIAEVRFTVWQTTAAAPPLGRWNRAGIRRVLRSSEPQNVPVVPPPPPSGGGGSSSDNTKAVLAVAAAALVGFAVTR